MNAPTTATCIRCHETGGTMIKTPDGFVHGQGGVPNEAECTRITELWAKTRWKAEVLSNLAPAEMIKEIGPSKVRRRRG